MLQAKTRRSLPDGVERQTAMYVVIVGCGRLGALLADGLSVAGHDVVVIDRHEASFRALSPEFSGFRLTGDATEYALLKSAEIERADCLMATCNEDTLNLMVAQVARHVFGVACVLARVHQPAFGAIFKEVGIEIISPTQLAFDAFRATLDARANRRP
ncbi:MAG: TrkA family potassium uptake protein [Desulfobacterales bacterium]